MQPNLHFTKRLNGLQWVFTLLNLRIVRVDNGRDSEGSVGLLGMKNKWIKFLTYYYPWRIYSSQPYFPLSIWSRSLCPPPAPSCSRTPRALLM